MTKQHAPASANDGNVSRPDANVRHTLLRGRADVSSILAQSSESPRRFGSARLVYTIRSQRLYCNQRHRWHSIHVPLSDSAHRW